MSQQEDDLRALAKIMDFLRAVSIILVVIHLYWYCYEAVRLWGIGIGVVDRVLMNFDRTAGLFHHILYTKLFALLLLALSCLGTKGVKEEKITWRRIWAVLAAGLPAMLLLSGGTAQPLDYVLLSASVLLMAIFFSVHHMVLYYLLQPYNENSEIKNPMFTIANAVTYLVSYFAVRQEIETSVFGVFLLIFCVLYILFALLAAYRLAPKTFCLRQ